MPRTASEIAVTATTSAAGAPVPRRARPTTRGRMPRAATHAVATSHATIASVRGDRRANLQRARLPRQVSRLRVLFAFGAREAHDEAVSRPPIHPFRSPVQLVIAAAVGLSVLQSLAFHVVLTNRSVAKPRGK